ncbi:MAG: Na+/H+ antiporter subunit G [Betaproteobacteria bacterium]
MVIDAIVSVLVLLGAAFALLGSIGLARFPDLLTRLHGPSKATTLGVGSLLVASIVFFSTRSDGLSLHELLITLFIAITAPVSAQFIALASRAAARGSTTTASERDRADDNAPGT